MIPKIHFLTGLIFSSLLLLIFPTLSPLGMLLFFLASFFIDVDHYLFYMIKKKDLSLKRALNWGHNRRKLYQEGKKPEEVFYFLHGIEWIMLFALLGYTTHNLFYYVSAGLLFHLLTDLTENIITKTKFQKFSVLASYRRYKRAIKKT